MGGPANDMQPFSQQQGDLFRRAAGGAMQNGIGGKGGLPGQQQPMQTQQVNPMQNRIGGKSGMPGQQQQTNPLQAQQQFSQQQAMSQGLGSLMNTQQQPQSSINSLQ
jgi:hypothetical protein